MMRAIPEALVCVTIVAAGCGAPDTTGYNATTDSAGVRITASRSPSWTDATAWRIGEAPVLDIGGDGSAATFERIAGVALHPDGGVVVADEGASTITAFDPDGRRLWRIGRAGDGPGEFRLIASIGTGPADSVWVFDFGNRRFTLINANGRVTRTLDLGTGISAPRAVGRLDDGSFIVQETWGGSSAGAAADGMRRELAAVVRVAPDDASIDTVTVRPGREVWLTVENGRGVMNTPLFSRNTVVTTAGNSIAVGDQAVFAIDIFDARGSLQRSVRLDGAEAPIDETEVRRAIDATVATLPESERAERRRFLEGVPLPAARPAFGRMIFKPTDRLWVSAYEATPADRAEWYVFESDGTWLGTISMPPRFSMLSIVAGRVAGVWRDELDVEHVRVYEIVRPAG